MPPKIKITKEEIDIMLSGDLLNQIMSSSFTARNLHIPFLGLYGACSTMTESMLVGSMLIDGGFAGTILAGASSHFCTAERQFRMPVEFLAQADDICLIFLCVLMDIEHISIHPLR